MPAPASGSRDRFEFLPAALEVLETPPAPFGRIVAITIVAFFAIAIVWAWIGTVDVVAVSQGKTIPAGKVKIVQPLETGVVRAIHATEGQSVAAGDLLIELDPTESTANIDALSIDLAQARLDAASGVALRAPDPVAAFVAPPDIDAALVVATRSLIADETGRHQSVLAAIRSEIVRTEAAIRGADIEKEMLKKIIPIVEQKLQTHEDLYTKEAVNLQELNEVRREFIEYTSALANAEEMRAQNLASI